MNNMELKAKIIEHYGADHQLAKAVEELTELTHVIARRLQDKVWDENAFFEELADVYAMLDQVKLIFVEEVAKKKYDSAIFNNNDVLSVVDICLENAELQKMERTKKRMKTGGAYGKENSN